MALFLCLLVIILGGALFGRHRTLGYARAGDFIGAERALRWGALLVGVCGVLATAATQGWPWKDSTKTVPEEVSKTAVETVEATVEVPRKLLFITIGKKKQTEVREQPKQVIEWVTKEVQSREFSPWLLLPMLIVGWICYRVQFPLVHLLWRWPPWGRGHK